MCQQGVNLGVSVTRHKAVLRELARKMVRRNDPKLLAEIEVAKRRVAENKAMLEEHLSWCDSC